jgi:hypothetical protein
LSTFPLCFFIRFRRRAPRLALRIHEESAKLAETQEDSRSNDFLTRIVEVSGQLQNRFAVLSALPNEKVTAGSLLCRRS